MHTATTSAVHSDPEILGGTPVFVGTTVLRGGGLSCWPRRGFPPAEVIRIATRNGAIPLGMISEFGTVEPGKRADLVVLGADPIADIGNTRRVEWVVQGGGVAPAASFQPERLRARTHH